MIINKYFKIFFQNQSLVWNVVFKSFGQEGFQLYNQKEFEFLLEAFSYIYNVYIIKYLV